MSNTSQLSFDYHTCFKEIYYQLYSNSNTSRAERIVSDVTKILLCKLIAEQNSVSDISSLSNAQLINLLKQYYPQSCDNFEDFSLSESDVHNALGLLDNISLSEAPSHVIGEAFQAIIGPRIRGDKGQFFTPKALVECMVKIANPQNGNVVIDPACGTGSFLSEAYIYAKSQGSSDEHRIHLIGVDKDRDMADIALATSEIISQGLSSVYNRNSLEILSPQSDLHFLLNSADLVLTNPPFGAKIGITDESILSLYEFGHNWTYSERDKTWYKLNTLAKNQAPQVLFLELCVQLLKPGGKMAIVLPEGIFGNKSLGYIWAYLRTHGRILAMIDCPRNTFQPSTDTKTNVLFYVKGDNASEEVMVSVAKHCGHDKRGRVKNTLNEPIQNDFLEIASKYNNDPEHNIWKPVMLSGSYFVPRYLAGSVISHDETEFITIGEMIKLGYLIRKSGKEVGSEAYGTGTVPFVRTSDIINFEISSDPTNSVSEEVFQQYSPQQNLQVGDILFIADGRYRIGKTAIITPYNLKCLIQSHIEILSLTKEAPFTPYEFLYLLNMCDVQEQVRNMIFIQSTLGTLGNRILEIAIRIPKRTQEWKNTIHAFQKSIEMRAECLSVLMKSEHTYEV